MKIPVPLKILVLAVLTTLFYTYVGQMVPQKIVEAPAVIEIAADVSTEQMVAIGKKIFEGKGMCSTCHTIGSSGSLRFPDLGGIATTAATRIDGMDQLEYLAQSMYEPDIFIVEGYNSGMPAIDKPPIGLTDGEILTVIAYLQSLGGTPDITMETKHAYNGEEGS